MWDATIGVIANVFSCNIVTWRHVGKDPIVIASLGKVYDISKDFFLRSDGIPKELEYAGGHFGVSDCVVRFPEDFFFGVARYFQEYIVRVADVTAKVSFADYDIFGIEEAFNSGRGKFHGGENVDSLRIFSARESNFEAIDMFIFI